MIGRSVRYGVQIGMLMVLLFSFDAAAQTIIDTSFSNSNLSSVAAILQNSNFTSVAMALTSPGITFLAPTNTAITALQDAGLAEMDTEDSQAITEALLEMHILQEPVDFDALAEVDVKEVMTAFDPSTAMLLYYVRLNDATLVSFGSNIARVVDSVQASDGYLYSVDTVLLPSMGAGVRSAFGINSALDAIYAAGLLGAIQGLEQYTLLLPDNEAFAEIDTTALTPMQLESILLAHVIPQRVLVEDGAEQTLETLSGDPVTISFQGDTALVNGTDLLTRNLEMERGVIQVLDSVLVPDRIMTSSDKTMLENINTIPELSVLAAAMDDMESDLTELQEFPDGVTLFLPMTFSIQEEKESLMSALNSSLYAYILPYQANSTELIERDHVQALTGDYMNVDVLGGYVVLDDGTPNEDARSVIFIADIQSSNGIIHLTDSLMAERMTFDQLLVSIGEDGVVAILQEVGLLDTIKDAEKVTVFLPESDDLEEAYESLDTDAFVALLKDHVVLGEVLFGSDLKQEPQFVTAASGSPIAVSMMNDEVRVNDTTVEMGDMIIKNGVVHFVDDPIGFDD